MKYAIFTAILALGLAGCNLNGVKFDVSGLPSLKINGDCAENPTQDGGGNCQLVWTNTNDDDEPPAVKNPLDGIAGPPEPEYVVRTLRVADNSRDGKLHLGGGHGGMNLPVIGTGYVGKTITTDFKNDDVVPVSAGLDRLIVTEENGWQTITERVGTDPNHDLRVYFDYHENGESFMLVVGGKKFDYSVHRLPTGVFTYGDESIVIVAEPNGEFWSLKGSVQGRVDFDNQLIDIVIESPDTVIRAENMTWKPFAPTFGMQSASAEFIRYKNSQRDEIESSESIFLGGHLNGAGEGMSGSFSSPEYSKNPISGVFAAERNSLTN